MTQEELMTAIRAQIHGARNIVHEMESEFPVRATAIWDLTVTCEMLLTYMVKFHDLTVALDEALKRAEGQPK